MWYNIIMEKQNMFDKEYLEAEFKAIEEMQDEVDRILKHKNPLVRFFLFNKAKRLHILAGKKLLALSYPYTVPIEKEL